MNIRAEIQNMSAERKAIEKARKFSDDLLAMLKWAHPDKAMELGLIQAKPKKGEPLVLVQKKKSFELVPIRSVTNTEKVEQKTGFSREELRKMGLPIPKRQTKAQRILSEVAKETGVSVGLLKSARRHKPVAKARQYAMFRLATETTASLPLIGRILGGKDHTTIIHGVKKYCSENAIPYPERSRK